MRLDHLLSKEYKFRKELKLWSARVIALFDFEDAVKKAQQPDNRRKSWGCSSAGRASALHAEGQEFDPPHLHQQGRIAQVVRAHA